MMKQPFLTVKAAAVSPQGPIGGDDAVAGNDDGNGVAPIRRADGSRCSLTPNPACKLRVAYGLSVTNRSQSLPDLILEGRASHPQQ